MSFLKIGDRAAGAIKSGGTTRRAAKMVVVDADHPDIEAYVDWKVREEDKVAALVAGSKALQKHLRAILRACVNCEGAGDSCFDPEQNPALKKEIKLARRAFVPDASIRKIVQYARQGFTDVSLATYDLDWDSEAYLTVAGQNSNNSVRITDDFLHAVENDGDWALTRRITGGVHKTLKARELWDKIGHGGLALGRPGPAVPHDDQRLAHVSGGGHHRRVEPVLRIHVPRRHGVQPRLAEPHAVPPRGPLVRHRIL